MTLDEIIQDLHALETRLRAYERKYGITSADFFGLYQQGFLDDEGYEQSTEFVRWASAFTLKQERETAFAKASQSFVAQLAPQTLGQSLHLMPNPALEHA